jgi:ribosome-associated protein
MDRSKDNPDEEIELVSKSQRKRDALELKSLASRLIAMDAASLARVPLDDSIRGAIDDARKIRSNVARKRQLQYTAKLLRRIDPAGIIEAIESLDHAARQLTARQHRCEAWRDYLLASGDEALEKLLEQDRIADVQAIRQLIRNAQREMRNDKPPSSARSLFRVLRDLDQDRPLPSIQA